jgi:hypothetical protein
MPLPHPERIKVVRRGAPGGSSGGGAEAEPATAAAEAPCCAKPEGAPDADSDGDDPPPLPTVSPGTAEDELLPPDPLALPLSDPNEVEREGKKTLNAGAAAPVEADAEQDCARPSNGVPGSDESLVLRDVRAGAESVSGPAASAAEAATASSAATWSSTRRIKSSTASSVSSGIPANAAVRVTGA